MDLRAPAARLGTTPGDALLAVALTVVVLSELSPATAASPALAAAVSVPVLLSLAWRRTHPLPVAVAVCGLNLWLSATAPGEFPPQLTLLPVLLVVYTAAAWCTGRRAAVGGVLTLLLLTTAHTLTGDGDPGDFLPYVLWVAPWSAGRMVQRRTQEAASAAVETARLREQRTQDLREAQEQERDRIARELHDVVAHAVSLMVVQAGAERLRLGTDAPRTREVLDAVETAGRHALNDLRDMLGLLRAPAAHEALAPAPGLVDLPALIEVVRAAGLPVELTQVGIWTGLPAALELSAYRVVQEALTNVLKHAGPVPTRVELRRDTDVLELHVASDLPPLVPAQRGVGGRGLLGMRERAHLHGGHVEAGPRDGQWVVRAVLPAEPR